LTQALATPTWIPGNPGPLAGWVHRVADEPVRGGVVICPPVGREGIIAYQTIRLLADRVAQAGLVALRFDYCATGDSGDQAEGLDGTQAWLASIRAGVAFLRSAGCESVALAGLRMGATLATMAANECGQLSALVVWDPVVSGRGFLREQRALQTLEIGPRPARSDDGDEALGFVYPGRLASDIRAIKLADHPIDNIDFADSADSTVPPCLILTRPSQSASALAALTSSPLVTTAPAPDQGELFDRRSFATVIPRAAIATIVGHLSDRAQGAATPIKLELEAAAVVAHTDDGAPIVERFAQFGPDNLFAVVTESGSTSDRSTLVCANVATEYHIGPGRAWVQLARQGAAQGLRTVRYDAPGLGDSVNPDDGDDLILYSPETRHQLIAFVESLRSQLPGPIGMVGSCSGAWEAAAVGGAIGLDAVWMINNLEWARTPPPGSGVEEGARAEEISQRGDVPETTRTRVRRVVKMRMPYQLWLALCRLGWFQTPELMLADLAKTRTRIRLVLSDTDGPIFIGQRGDRAVTRLRRRGVDIKVAMMETVDHALFMQAGREEVLALVLNQAAVDLAAPSDPDAVAAAPIVS
jgi:pimeloyl-ACP methyl ester carboxylesterase